MATSCQNDDGKLDCLLFRGFLIRYHKGRVWTQTSDSFLVKHKGRRGRRPGTKSSPEKEVRVATTWGDEPGRKGPSSRPGAVSPSGQRHRPLACWPDGEIGLGIT